MNKSLRCLSHWRTEYRCVNCKRVLGDWFVHYSNGRCPACGHKDEMAGTIVETTEHAYRLATNGRWWQFWKPRWRVYKDG